MVYVYSRQEFGGAAEKGFILGMVKAKTAKLAETMRERIGMCSLSKEESNRDERLDQGFSFPSGQPSPAGTVSRLIYGRYRMARRKGKKKRACHERQTLFPASSRVPATRNEQPTITKWE